mgnify:CR=1 FL=1
MVFCICLSISSIHVYKKNLLVDSLSSYSWQLSAIEKEKSGKYRKEQDKIVQEYHKKEYLEKILKKSGFEIVEIKEFFLHTDESADKLIFICKKYL